MAHRGPLRELFGILCIAIIVPNVEKISTPPPNTGFVIEPTDEVLHTIMVPQVIDSPTAGFLSFFFPILATCFSIIGEELINIAFMYFLTAGLIPSMRVIKRFTMSIGTKGTRLLQAWGLRTSEVTTPSEDDNDEWFDALESQPALGDIPNSTTVPAANDQALAVLRAESAGKEAQITILTEAARDKNKTIRDLNRGNDRFVGTLRATLDPRGLYPAATDLVVVADHLSRDMNRLSNKSERQTKALKEVQDREQEISSLTTQNTKLQDRVRGLEVGQLDSVRAVENIERSFKSQEKKLKERALNAERDATRDMVPISGYRLKLDQVHSLEKAVTDAQQATAEAKSEGEAALEKVRDEVTDLKSTIGNLQENQKQREQEAKRLKEEYVEQLELANKAVQDAAKNAEEAEKESAAAVREAETAEKRIKTAEEKPTEEVEKVADLQQQLKRADDCNADIKQQLNAITEANQKLLGQLESKRGEPALAGEARAKKLESEKEELLTQLSTIQQQTIQPAPEITVETIKSWLNQGYQEAVKDCEQEAQRLIANAVQQEKSDAEQRLTVALTQSEEAVTASFRVDWNNREVNFQATLDAEVQRVAGEREAALRSERDSAVQRATVAEDKNDNPKGEVKEARDYATQLYDNGVTLFKRAEAAEEEVKKYQEGKESQDQRIKDLHQTVSELKRKLPSDQQAAEIQATENDRVRGWALVQELRERHYDYPSRDVLDQLLEANRKIDTLKSLLQNPTARCTSRTYLTILQNGEVSRDSYRALEDSEMRQVLVKQCAAVNARLAMLRTMINGTASKEGSDSADLLAEILKPRGDENARWNTIAPKPEPPESDEDEDTVGEQKGPERLPVQGRHIRAARKPAPQPKPTKIPGPKPEASLTRSEQQETIASAHNQNSQTAPVAANGDKGPSFSAPKDIASGILPHVRTYTRLSGTTNTVLSRRQPNPSSAKHQPDL